MIYFIIFYAICAIAMFIACQNEIATNPSYKNEKDIVKFLGCLVMGIFWFMYLITAIFRKIVFE